MKFRIQRLMIRIYLRYFSLLIYLVAKLFLLFEPAKPYRSKSLLILKPDAVGDFILFRNFLRFIRSSKRFKGYHLTWCGNVLQKRLIEQFDGELVDDCIWIDKTRIYWDVFYYIRLARSIFKQFEVTIHPVVSREFLFDFYASVSGVRERIGFSGDTVNINPAYHRLANGWYTELIETDPADFFEFSKNRTFFGTLLREDIAISKPYFEPTVVQKIDVPDIPKAFAVIFPGAQMSFRRWSTRKFAEVADFIYGKYGLSIVIAGSKQDKSLATAIVSRSTCKPIDLTGLTTFSQLIGVVSRACLLVSNDTSAVHIAAAQGVPVVALSQMNHYGRFIPYPAKLKIPMRCVIPADYEDLSFPELVEKFKNGSMVSIDLITVDQVTRAVEEVLQL